MTDRMRFKDRAALVTGASSGIGRACARALGAEPDEWDRIMDSDLRSVFLLTRAAAPELMKRRGSIVSISSVAGLRPYGGLLAYCVSKAGVDMLTRCAALDLAPHGVRVNA